MANNANIVDVMTIDSFPYKENFIINQQGRATPKIDFPKCPEKLWPLFIVNNVNNRLYLLGLAG